MNKNDLLDNIIGMVGSINKSSVLQGIQKKLKGENVLLSHLFDVGGECSPSELSKVLDVTAARVTVILHSLENKKLVERIADGTDRRKMIVKITENGKKLVEQLKAEALFHSSIIFEKLGEKDANEFVRIMNRIIEIGKSGAPSAHNHAAPENKN